MTTVSTLIDQISSQLHSFTGVIENATHLTSDIDADDTNIPVGQPESISRGLIEIDDELLHVISTGPSSVDLAPWGRGAGGSTAASHTANAKVTNDPLIPRVRIFEALKQTLLQCHPDLFVLTDTTFAYSTTQMTYELPAGVERVLSVQYETIGPSQVWQPVTRWSLDRKAEVTGERSLTIAGACIPAGRTVQVVYAGAPPVPADTAVDLETSGIQASWHDLLVYGACWRLTQFLEPQRFQLRSVEQQARATDVPIGAVSKVADQFLRMFMQRRAEERRKLLDLYPPRVHYGVR